MIYGIKNTFVSSANKINVISGEVVARSFMYSKYSNGPSMKPCGTPHVIVKTKKQLLLDTRTVFYNGGSL